MKSEIKCQTGNMVPVISRIAEIKQTWQLFSALNTKVRKSLTDPTIFITHVTRQILSHLQPQQKQK